MIWWKNQFIKLKKNEIFLFILNNIINEPLKVLLQNGVYSDQGLSKVVALD